MLFIFMFFIYTAKMLPIRFNRCLCVCVWMTQILLTFDVSSSNTWDAKNIWTKQMLEPKIWWATTKVKWRKVKNEIDASMFKVFENVCLSSSMKRVFETKESAVNLIKVWWLVTINNISSYGSFWALCVCVVMMIISGEWFLVEK